MMRKSNIETILNILNYVFMTVLSLTAVFPLFYVFMASFIGPDDYKAYGITLIPKHISFYNYSVLFSSGSKLVRAYGVTIYLVVVGTVISLFLTSMIAYGISKKYLPGRMVLTFIIYFTMLFSGGLIPTYMVVKATGLYGTLWALIIPGAVGAWNIFLMRNFFMAIPVSLEESAKIDGANDIYILFKIFLPLSVPCIATLALFCIVAYWNEWFGAMIYINDSKKHPLQLVLKFILTMNTMPIDPQIAGELHKKMPPSDLVKMSSIVATTLPILCAYPFLQKYFIKGVLVGSVKG